MMLFAPSLPLALPLQRSYTRSMVEQREDKGVGEAIGMGIIILGGVAALIASCGLAVRLFVWTSGVGEQPETPAVAGEETTTDGR